MAVENIFRVLKSIVAGRRPPANPDHAGIPFVNFADKQFGVMDTAGKSVDLLAVRHYSADAKYATHDLVVHNGVIYKARSAISPGRWSAAHWTHVTTLRLGETATTAYAGNKGKANRAAIVTAQTQADKGVSDAAAAKALTVINKTAVAAAMAKAVLNARHIATNVLAITKNKRGLAAVVAQKGAHSGLAELDSSGHVPTAQLPAYVDDVIEAANKAAFPAAGEAGKIYLDQATNLAWRWSGTAYIEIAQGLALGETSATAYRGDRGKTAFDSVPTIAVTKHDATKNYVPNDLVGINGSIYKANRPVTPGAFAENKFNSLSFSDYLKGYRDNGEGCTAIPVTTSLDTYIESGMFSVTFNHPGLAGIARGHSGFLEIKKYTAGQVIQLFTVIANSQNSIAAYYRVNTGTSWAKWVIISENQEWVDATKLPNFVPGTALTAGKYTLLARASNISKTVQWRGRIVGAIAAGERIWSIPNTHRAMGINILGIDWSKKIIYADCKSISGAVKIINNISGGVDINFTAEWNS